MKSHESWIWMPHAAHFCLGDKCIFHLATYVNGYIVSTVGDHWPDEGVRRIFLECRTMWPKVKPDGTLEYVEFYQHELDKVKELKGDSFNYEYKKMFGFEEVGLNRMFETMVFEADTEEAECECCPYVIKSGCSVDFDSYNLAPMAFLGHYDMCWKWHDMVHPDCQKTTT